MTRTILKMNLRKSEIPTSIPMADSESEVSIQGQIPVEGDDSESGTPSVTGSAKRVTFSDEMYSEDGEESVEEDPVADAIVDMLTASDGSRISDVLASAVVILNEILKEIKIHNKLLHKAVHKKLTESK
jgi:hypothetical protein